MRRLIPDHRAGWPAVGLAAVLAALAGCQGGGLGTLSRWRTARDGTLAKPTTAAERGEDVQDSRNLMARWLTPSKAPHAGRESGLNGTRSIGADQRKQAEAEFAGAEALFQKGQLAEAEAAFARAARTWKDTPWGQKAQFYLAETQYQRGKYVAANDSFAKLVSDYPGTDYLDKAVAREYAIACRWLDSIDAKAEPEAKGTWKDHLDGTRPLVDVSGHALAALEHVRHHDPTGPLADDAVMKIADYHYSRGNYEDAALFYDQLINDLPKSPFLQKAQLASIDAKIKSYMGPDYDGTQLEQAREMIKRTNATFPERQAATSEALSHNLALINDQQAEISYRRGEFYRRTGKVQAAEFYFAQIPARWPKSDWSKKAKVQLAELAKMPRKATLPSKIMTRPGSVDPYAAGNSAGSMATMPGAGMGGPGAGSGPGR